MLANWLNQGKVCLREPTEAEFWFRKAAASSVARLQRELALVLDATGNTAEAADWLRKAADSDKGGDDEGATKASDYC